MVAQKSSKWIFKKSIRQNEIWSQPPWKRSQKGVYHCKSRKKEAKNGPEKRSNFGKQENEIHDEELQIQKITQKEDTRKTLQKIYRDKFGENDYYKIKEFKTWIENHEKGGEIMAFLKDKNPLQFW